ncbi:Uncharacterised protein [Vibrio cholerae]|nr:Uncharacterised protein [Vibrio cholerae]
MYQPRLIGTLNLSIKTHTFHKEFYSILLFLYRQIVGGLLSGCAD